MYAVAVASPSSSGADGSDTKGVVPVTGAAKQHRRSILPLLSAVILRAQSDERLCELTREGSRPAFETIFDRYSRELRAHAARIVRADRADDVVQQAMLKAWTTIVAGENVVELRAWLHRIVHNAALNTIARRSYNDSAIPADSPAATRTEELAESRLTAAGALTSLAALPDGQRTALTLTAIDGHSGREAAQTMGISEPALRQLVSRGRSSMRSGVSAITPVPLLAWATAGAGDSATAGLAGAGVAGGIAVTAAKVAAVIGVTGAAIGGVHALQPGDGRKHRSAPEATPARTSAIPQQRFTPAFGVVPLAGRHGSSGGHINQGQAGDRSGAGLDALSQSRRGDDQGRHGQSGSDGARQGAQDRRGAGVHGAGETAGDGGTAGRSPETAAGGGSDGASNGAPSANSGSP